MSGDLNVVVLAVDDCSPAVKDIEGFITMHSDPVILKDIQGRQMNLIKLILGEHVQAKTLEYADAWLESSNHRFTSFLGQIPEIFCISYWSYHPLFYLSSSLAFLTVSLASSA